MQFNLDLHLSYVFVFIYRIINLNELYTYRNIVATVSDTTNRHNLLYKDLYKPFNKYITRLINGGGRTRRKMYYMFRK